jgi:hypothetical protein
MNFEVKIKEISFYVVKDLQCPQPHEGNIQRSQGYKVNTLLNSMLNIEAPQPPLK